MRHEPTQLSSKNYFVLTYFNGGALKLNWSCHILSLETSVTRLGDFWKFLVKVVVIKVAQMYSDFFGYFENNTFQVKTAVGTIGHLLEKFGLLYLNILPHCFRRFSSYIITLGQLIRYIVDFGLQHWARTLKWLSNAINIAFALTKDDSFR